MRIADCGLPRLEQGVFCCLFDVKGGLGVMWEVLFVGRRGEGERWLVLRNSKHRREKPRRALRGAEERSPRKTRTGRKDETVRRGNSAEEERSGGRDGPEEETGRGKRRSGLAAVAPAVSPGDVVWCVWGVSRVMLFAFVQPLAEYRPNREKGNSRRGTTGPEMWLARSGWDGVGDGKAK